MGEQPRSDRQGVEESDSSTARDAMVRESRRRAAVWGILTGLAMTVVALGCIALLYLALGR
ncbi:MAG TPA: hypothetical protein PLR44_07065 [Thermomicrobiales bacterium]|nr:hypothetical protein [Chloroflexota bacterium]HQZ89797.1 hypothetical protein [Thermomicrobiales bacterium]HRA30477.1 hypothetical protein [Thermomicrobiales bacterium]